MAKIKGAPLSKRQRRPVLKHKVRVPGEPPKPVPTLFKARGVSAVVLVPRIRVCIKIESTEHEGGSDGGSYGDVLVKGYTQGTRFAIAGKLRELADQIANTIGEPMVSASITVLMSRPRG